MEQRKIYPSLDIMKFIMAMLILTQHTSNEWAHSTGLVHAFFGLGNFAVPFFFACSGFLFFSKYNTLSREDQRDYYKKWSLRIGKMYLVWSLIYFVFVFIGWLREGLNWFQPLDYIHWALVFTTYATIWFLPALWVGVSICCLLTRYCNRKTIVAIILLLMVIGNLFGSYTNVLTQVPAIDSFNEWYLNVFITWRNGIFNGAPFVSIGILVAEGKGMKLSARTNLLLTVLFGAAFLVEAFSITRLHLSTATDMGFMMVPAIFFMISWLTQVNVKQRPLWQHCRNLSMLIFLGQRLFLSALPGVVPGMKQWILALPEPCIYLYFIVVVLTFSILIERLSNKFKFLKILW